MKGCGDNGGAGVREWRSEGQENDSKGREEKSTSFHEEQVQRSFTGDKAESAATFAPLELLPPSRKLLHWCLVLFPIMSAHFLIMPPALKLSPATSWFLVVFLI